MGKENWKISDIVNRSSNRYNPYATPVYLRPLKESRLFGFSRGEISNIQSVDADALLEYQNFLKRINSDSGYTPDTSTPISSHLHKKIGESSVSPAFPIKQLHMERKTDSLLQKLVDLKQRIREIPNTLSCDLPPLSFLRKTQLENDRLEQKNTNELPSTNNGIGRRFSCFSRLKPTKNSISSVLNDSFDLNNEGDCSKSIISRNPFRFNCAPTPRFDASVDETKDRCYESDISQSTSIHIPFHFNYTPIPRVSSPFASSNRSSPSPTINNTDPADIDTTLCSMDRLNNSFRDKFKSTPDLSRISSESYFQKSLLIFKDDFAKKELSKQHDVSAAVYDNSQVLNRCCSVENTTKLYRDKKYQDEEEQRLMQIRELEKEARERLKARLNRQILSEEYRRLRLELEGLILERPKKEEPFPELPDDANELLERAWNHILPHNEIFVKAFGIDVSRKDLLSLSGLEWLNDEIVNFYMNLIMERSRNDINLPKTYAFSTFFYPNISVKGYDSVKRWTRKIDIFSFDLLLVPIHLTAHWCMAVVDIKENCIIYYDSMLGSNDRCLNLLRDYLGTEHFNKKNEPLNTNNWRLICRKDIPRQLNGSDCGIFACKFAEYASRRTTINFTQAQMPYFRQRMVYEICKQTLL